MITFLSFYKIAIKKVKENLLLLDFIKNYMND